MQQEGHDAAMTVSRSQNVSHIVAQPSRCMYKLANTVE